MRNHLPKQLWRGFKKERMPLPADLLAQLEREKDTGVGVGPQMSRTWYLIGFIFIPRFIIENFKHFTPVLSKDMAHHKKGECGREGAARKCTVPGKSISRVLQTYTVFLRFYSQKM